MAMFDYWYLDAYGILRWNMMENDDGQRDFEESELSYPLYPPVLGKPMFLGVLPCHSFGPSPLTRLLRDRQPDRVVFNAMDRRTFNSALYISNLRIT